MAYIVYFTRRRQPLTFFNHGARKVSPDDGRAMHYVYTVGIREDPRPMDGVYGGSGRSFTVRTTDLSQPIADIVSEDNVLNKTESLSEEDRLTVISHLEKLVQRSGWKSDGRPIMLSDPNSRVIELTSDEYSALLSLVGKV